MASLDDAFAEQLYEQELEQDIANNINNDPESALFTLMERRHQDLNESRNIYSTTNKIVNMSLLENMESRLANVVDLNTPLTDEEKTYSASLCSELELLPLENQFKLFIKLYHETLNKLMLKNSELKEIENRIKKAKDSVSTLLTLCEPTPENKETSSKTIKDWIKEFEKKENLQNVMEEHKMIYNKFRYLRQILKLVKDEPLNKYTCNVCLHKHIEVLLYPCKHTLCDNCNLSIGNQCPFCRQPISEKLKMYIDL